MTRLLWIARPQFVLSGLALFIFGISLAILMGAPFSLVRTLLGYLILLPAHLSISYSNDYFDVDVDKYDKPTFFSGGSGVLVDHPELRKPALWTAVILTMCSLAFGIVFQIVYSFPFWLLGGVLLGNLLGWFYSAPPLRLAYRGLGELAMIISVGLLIPGSGFVVTSGQMNLDGLPFSAPMMLYGLAFIIAVEIPDMESDRLGHKMTWVARRGRRFGFTLIAASFLLATLCLFCFPWLATRSYPLDFRFLGMLSLLPLGTGCIGFLKKPMEKQSATRAVNAIMITVAVFCVLADAYLISLVIIQMR